MQKIYNFIIYFEIFVLLGFNIMWTDIVFTIKSGQGAV